MMTTKTNELPANRRELNQRQRDAAEALVSDRVVWTRQGAKGIAARLAMDPAEVEKIARRVWK